MYMHVINYSSQLCYSEIFGTDPVYSDGHNILNCVLRDIRSYLDIQTENNIRRGNLPCLREFCDSIETKLLDSIMR